MSDRSALKRSTLAFRHLLEGYREVNTWVPGDLELVLRGYGIFRDRDWLDPTRLSHLGEEGLALRARLEEAIKALIPALPEEVRQSPREALQYATTLYLREVAYTWFNRLVALRCLEARVPGLDEAIKGKSDYAGRSLRHDRFCRQYHIDSGSQAELACDLHARPVSVVTLQPLLDIVQANPAAPSMGELALKSARAGVFYNKA